MRQGLKLFACGLFFLPYLAVAQSESVTIEALVSGCGNGVIETGEACDGVNYGGQSCQSIGFGSGVLSCSASCTLVTTSCVALPPASPSGGSATRPRGVTPVTTSFSVRGQVTPQSTVYILRDGVRVTTTIASPTGYFQTTIPNLSTGTHHFSMYAVTPNGLRTAAYTFPYYQSSPITTTFERVAMSPVTDIAQTSVSAGQSLDVYGETIPNATVYTVVYQSGKAVAQATTSSDMLGRYSLLFSTKQLPQGSYTLLTYAMVGTTISAPSRVLQFTISAQEVPRYRDFDTCVFVRGDVNRDCRIDMRDILLAREWSWGRGVMGLTELERLSGDGRIDMRDFSIILYNWTG
jgi:hypothetical protein